MPWFRVSKKEEAPQDQNPPYYSYIIGTQIQTFVESDINYTVEVETV